MTEPLMIDTLTPRVTSQASLWGSSCNSGQQTFARHAGENTWKDIEMFLQESTMFLLELPNRVLQALNLSHCMQENLRHTSANQRERASPCQHTSIISIYVSAVLTMETCVSRRQEVP